MHKVLKKQGKVRETGTGGMQNGSRICKIQILRGGRGSEQMSLSGWLSHVPLHIHVLSAQRRNQAKGNQVFSSLTSTSHERLLLN